jgi:hypothetical protein
MTTVVQGRHTCRPLKQSHVHGARICNSIQWRARSSCTASSGTRPYIQLHLMRARCTSPLESLHNRIDSGAPYTSPADTITRTFRPQIQSHVHFTRRYNHTYISPADTITRTFRPQIQSHVYFVRRYNHTYISPAETYTHTSPADANAHTSPFICTYPLMG